MQAYTVSLGSDYMITATVVPPDSSMTKQVFPERLDMDKLVYMYRIVPVPGVELEFDTAFMGEGQLNEGPIDLKAAIQLLVSSFLEKATELEKVDPSTIENEDERTQLEWLRKYRPDFELAGIELSSF